MHITAEQARPCTLTTWRLHHITTLDGTHMLDPKCRSQWQHQRNGCWRLVLPIHYLGIWRLHNYLFTSLIDPWSVFKYSQVRVFFEDGNAIWQCIIKMVLALSECVLSKRALMIDCLLHDRKAACKNVACCLLPGVPVAHTTNSRFGRCSHCF